MNTIADFKRSMIPGTFWQATHEYIGDNSTPVKDLGVRECILNNSVDFGFKTASGSISHSQWPKKSEFSTSGNTVVITKDGFCRLTYTQVKQ